MSLPVFDPQTHLFGLQSRSSDVFSETDRYRLFAQKIYPLLVEARPKLEACYCQNNGRPAVEPVLLLGVWLPPSGCRLAKPSSGNCSTAENYTWSDSIRPSQRPRGVLPNAPNPTGGFAAESSSLV